MNLTHTPASAIPRNHLAAAKPEKFLVTPMQVIQTPHMTVQNISLHQSTFHAHGDLPMHILMMAGKKMLGRKRFNKMLVRGSKPAYETKNNDRQALYWPGVMWRSVTRPWIFAFPMFVRSVILLDWLYVFRSDHRSY